jgi:AcrR family transcriptional regulator
MSRPNAGQTARERARTELTREIKEEARQQLAVSGADGLSLRAVARSLGMVSSALYRYFPSRDDLLTALIIDAYDAVGSAAEAATGPASTGDACGRWVATCRSVRSWALDHPHEYALIYGSPVPGYRAPSETVGPASRVPLAFVAVLRDAVAAGAISEAHAVPQPAAVPLILPPDGPLVAQAAALAAAMSPREGPAVPPDVLVRAVIAWTQLFGMISFELFGQFVGSFEPADAFFEHAIAQMANFVGLRRASEARLLVGATRVNFSDGDPERAAICSEMALYVVYSDARKASTASGSTRRGPI